MKHATMSFRSLFILLAAFLLTACGNDHDIRTRIDGDWHRQTLEKDHLEHWLKALPTANGFFNTTVTRDWQVLDPQPGDLVGHTRGIYLMAVGHELTCKPAYLEQVQLGTDFLLRHFRDPQHGGWFEAVGPDGKPRNDNKRLYSQAFAIFALAHAYRATQDKRYLDAALQTWSEIRLRYLDAHGGFRAGTNRDFSQTKQGNSQNPIMHLFEALLALHQASGSREALDGAESIGKFVAYQLLEGLPDGTARIPELYDEQWRPLPGARGGRIDIGHQFEWAYLFSAATEAGLNPIYAGVANRLLDYALAMGYEKGVQGIITSISPEGGINPKRSYWQQAEALRALIHHAAIQGRSDLWGHVTQQIEYIRKEFLDKQNGGWHHSTLTECRKSTCPDRQPDGYHMTALHQEAIRIAALAR
jgi:mannose-6-phosphate isomerase